jgi:glucans biosynthesis protein
MVQRRDLLKYAAGGAAGRAAGWVFPTGFAVLDATQAAAQAPGPRFGLADPTPFAPGMVTDAARDLARQPFKAAPADLPSAFANLTYEQYVGIRNRPSTTIWATDNLGFALEPLHRGFIFGPAMQINLVSDATSRRLVYAQEDFDFGKLTVPPDLGDIGFSGFRVLAPRDGGGTAELATFQGASFFRAVARGQNLGTMARALSIRTADPKGEEFPAIRKVWIEQPSLAGGVLVIHALIDSESVSGAYRFTVHPGEATIIDTECTLFARGGVDNFGLATMSGTHLFGMLDRRRVDDLRPTVSEIGGLQMLTGKGEWLWRPVTNRETLQISSFGDENPRGFGFLQRDRAFADYEDDDQHWEARPSLWIEPIGDWGQGALQLIEIPSESEVNDNIIAYWRPKQPLAAGSETMLAYRQFWCWTPPEQPPLATAILSSSGRGSGAKRRRFLVAFAGDILADPQLGEVKADLTLGPGTLASTRLFRTRDKKGCRVLFEVDPGSETYSELRLLLTADGKPVSETWLYRWTS